MKDRLKGLPSLPGVYCFLDAKGAVIYVGKAKNLKSRVSSYFAAHLTNIKTFQMMKNAKDFKFIVTETEREAFLLESNMIKADKPKYNILLKDSSSYPYVKITQEAFPRIYYTRDLRDRSAKYFGPFIGGGNLRQIMEKIQQVFPLRSCSNREFAKGKICLLYQIDRCLGPCEGLIGADDYRAMVARAALFFNGGTEEVKAMLQAEESQSAEQLDFERAASAKDKLSIIENIFQSQSVSDITDNPTDVFFLYTCNNIRIINSIFIRNRHIIASTSEIFFEGQDDLFQAFIYQFYNNNRQFPHTIVTGGGEVEDGFAENLSALAGVSVKHRVRGFASVFLMAQRNAEVVLKTHMDGVEKHAVLSRRLSLLLSDNPERALLDDSRRKIPSDNIHSIKPILGTILTTMTSVISSVESVAIDDEMPSQSGGIDTELLNIKTVECIDISHSYGVYTVGSSVMYYNGKMFPRGYRKYKIRTAGNDDFASLSEVLRRKVAGITSGKERKSDLYIIDGGKGQLSSAWRMVSDSGIDINMIAISKGRSLKREKSRKGAYTQGVDFIGVESALSGDYISIETIHTVNGESFKLKGGDPLLLLIQRMRNEAHRFAIKYMRTLMNSSMSTSIIKDVEGVGDARLALLMSKIPNILHRKGITAEEVHETTGIPLQVCERIVSKIVEELAL